jgi:hypothetical protein
MILEDFMKLSDEAMSRDPRNFPYGYFSGGTFVLDSTRVFMWFSSPEELVNHICEFDLINNELDKDEVQAIKAKVHEIVGNPVELSNEKLQKINEAVKEFLCIEWWGAFDELAKSDSELAREMRESMREDGSNSPVTESEMDEFVDLVHNYGF